MFSKEENYHIELSSGNIIFTLTIPSGPVIHKCYTSDVLRLLKDKGYVNVGPCIENTTVTNDPTYPGMSTGVWIFRGGFLPNIIKANKDINNNNLSVLPDIPVLSDTFLPLLENTTSSSRKNAKRKRKS